jgi:hypothetical protein
VGNNIFDVFNALTNNVCGQSLNVSDDYELQCVKFFFGICPLSKL